MVYRVSRGAIRRRKAIFVFYNVKFYYMGNAITIRASISQYETD